MTGGFYVAVFAIASAAIAISGPQLCRSANVIASRTGLGAGWIGVILLSTVTSLPELATGASAVIYWDAPDIAVGDALGSCVFNLALLFVADSMVRGTPIYSRAHVGHILSAAFGIVLIGFVGQIIVTSGAGKFAPVVGHVGFSSLLVLGLYLVGIRSVYLHEREHRSEFEEASGAAVDQSDLADACGRYAVAAVVVVLAGVAMPYAGGGIAELMGWNETFVGTLFVAAATSLPELAVTVAAVRFGAVNLAVAGLLGSNMFNMAIIAVEDILYVKGPLLVAVSPTHAVSSLSALVMSGLVVVGLQYRSPRKTGGTVGWISMSLFAIYLLNSYLTYLHDR